MKKRGLIAEKKCPMCGGPENRRLLAEETIPIGRDGCIEVKAYEIIKTQRDRRIGLPGRRGR